MKDPRFAVYSTRKEIAMATVKRKPVAAKKVAKKAPAKKTASKKK